MTIYMELAPVAEAVRADAEDDEAARRVGRAGRGRQGHAPPRHGNAAQPAIAGTSQAASRQEVDGRPHERTRPGRGSAQRINRSDRRGSGL